MNPAGKLLIVSTFGALILFSSATSAIEAKKFRHLFDDFKLAADHETQESSNAIPQNCPKLTGNWSGTCKSTTDEGPASRNYRVTIDQTGCDRLVYEGEEFEIGKAKIFQDFGSNQYASWGLMQWNKNANMLSVYFEDITHTGPQNQDGLNVQHWSFKQSITLDGNQLIIDRVGGVNKSTVTSMQYSNAGDRCVLSR
jgi:hypothetical protein